MVSKKQKRLMQRQRLEGKAESSNWRESRGARYERMKREGVLGSQELSKYHEMYSFLRPRVSDFNFPSVDSEEKPRRWHYNNLQLLYSNYLQDN